ncbi:MAG: class I SAM-dependent DNA methyltransferase [Thermoanaerobaculia bacterium]|jgi:hypothetical protein|nr:class I SAM-dependent DNA methyltransferase [Thermoanaerobaculia bacterium]
MDIAAFQARWLGNEGGERANKDPFLNDLCDLLGVPRPDPATGDAEKDLYVYEKPAVLLHAAGKPTIGKIDLYRHGRFLLEAKQGSNATRTGRTRRGTNAWHGMMSDALGQAKRYVETLDAPPPFLLVVDIGHCVDLYASFDGSRAYHPFPNALANRTFFADLEELLPTLHAVWEEPLSLDPLRRTTAVTREVAAHLAGLSKELAEAGHSPEAVATFLMRAIFTMFAEDVGLLPNRLFTRTLYERWIPHPETFAPDVQALWTTMNRGGPFGFEGELLRFNGGLFAAPQALALTRRQLEMLHEAARCDWKNVEPSIFGTLLERALDPKERHALGAHFTPRAYVERLVRATVEEPLRAEWDVVRTLVRTLVEEGTEAKIAEAEKAVRAFHEKLCATRVLDPACGTGNFLYVTLDLFKRLEAEVVRLLRDLRPETGASGFLDLHGVSVTPRQLLGIEVKRWAKEIAELVLWIGWLQWHFRTHGDTAPEQPVLRDYGNIECRDAVLAWDRVEPETDAAGKPVTRWDGEMTKPSPVTGEPIPDETARVVVERYVNPRKAEWPEAEFVVGNPPFVGNKRMRTALGDGYVEALRNAHDDVPESADLVMYWWNHAATLVRAARLTRFGLITTNSITQTYSRRIVERALKTGAPASIVFATADHPWVDSGNGAAVRIAMTVVAPGMGEGTLLDVVAEGAPDADGAVLPITRIWRGRIAPDLSLGPAASGIVALKANEALSFMGVTLIGNGFRLTSEEASALGWPTSPVVRPFFMGRDLAEGQGHRFVIDLFGLTEAEARMRYPSAFQRALNRVKPEREINARRLYRERWWVFGEAREGLRKALKAVSRYIVTARTAKHRVFQFVTAGAMVDSNVIAVAVDDAWVLGLLSSRGHTSWALSTGATLEDRPHYTSSTVFAPFPFPAADAAQTARIRSLGEALDAHRKRQQALHPGLTITGMYNVLEKLRSGEALTAKEKVIHEQGLVSVLKQIHDELDAAVFEAYGWPSTLTDEEILERLVALNAERAEEEKRGLVRWLRPEFQNPGGAKAATQEALPGGDDEEEEPAAKAAAPLAWPKALPERIAAVRDLMARAPSPRSLAAVTSAFAKAKPKDVETVLESLASLGLLVSFDASDGRHWQAAAAPRA